MPKQKIVNLSSSSLQNGAKKNILDECFFLLNAVIVTTIESRVPVESADFSIYLYYQYH